MGIGIAADHDGGTLGQAQVALAQCDALAPGQRDQLDEGAMQQPSVGGTDNRFGLDGDIQQPENNIAGKPAGSAAFLRNRLLRQRRYESDLNGFAVLHGRLFKQ